MGSIVTYDYGCKHPYCLEIYVYNMDKPHIFWVVCMNCRRIERMPITWQITRGMTIQNWNIDRLSPP